MICRNLDHYFNTSFYFYFFIFQVFQVVFLFLGLIILQSQAFFFNRLRLNRPNYPSRPVYKQPKPSYQSRPVVVEDGYGAPAAPVISSADHDSYGSPAAPVVSSSTSYQEPESGYEVQDTYR